MTELFQVVHEDANLLIINKPAGLVCHPTKGDVYSSLISRIRLYLGPDVPVHLVNRLDRETSGLVMVAKSDETAAVFRRKWEQGLVEKVYLAVVEGAVPDVSGTIDAPIGPDGASPVAIKGCVDKAGAPSQTAFERIHVFRRAEGTFTLLRLRPRSGRKHQIRIHLAHYGHPIVGDKIYGPDELIYLAFVEGRMTAEQAERLRLPNHALHAGGLSWMDGETVHSHWVKPDRVFSGFVERGEPDLTSELVGFLVPAAERIVGTLETDAANSRT